MEMEKLIGERMETILIAALVGVILGGGVTAGVAVTLNKSSRDEFGIEATRAAAEAVKQSADVMKTQSQPAINLTEPDLLKVPCSSEYIDKNGDTLCREMFCRMQTRGIDAKASGQECEQISNINNTIAIDKVCADKQGDERTACLDVFWRRK
jgi:hypothetical protein